MDAPDFDDMTDVLEDVDFPSGPGGFLLFLIVVFFCGCVWCYYHKDDVKVPAGKVEVVKS